MTNTEQEFKECIRYVKIAMDETGTSMDRSESGPIQTIPLLKQLCAISHLKCAQNEILQFCMEVVKDFESSGTYFENHAEIGMSLAYLLSGSIQFKTEPNPHLSLRVEKISSTDFSSYFKLAAK